MKISIGGTSPAAEHLRQMIRDTSQPRRETVHYELNDQYPAFRFVLDTGDRLAIDSVDSPLEARVEANLEELCGDPYEKRRVGGNRDERVMVIDVPERHAKLVAIACYRALLQVTGHGKPPLQRPVEPAPLTDGPALPIERERTEGGCSACLCGRQVCLDALRLPSWKRWLIRKLLPSLLPLLLLVAWAAPAAAQGQRVAQGAAGTQAWVVTASQTGIWNVGIWDGVTFATIRDLPANDALNVAIVDAAGNHITSFGGGTQYTQDDVDATPTGTVVFGKDASDVLKALPIDGSGNLIVNCAAGCVPGGSFADDDAFTFGTTAVGISAGVLDDAAPNAATENSAAAARISSNRNWLFQLRDGGGNERGASVTAANALKVDGSAVTQPVSDAGGSLTVDGTVTVVQGTGTNLHIVCDSGCGGAATFADDDAFTFGTTPINVSGYVFDDVAPNAATENSAAAPRMSSNRVPYVEIRDGAGNERGANVSAGGALVVDGSAVTQPISAASLPLPTGAGTAANQTTIIGHVDGIEGLLTTIDADTGGILTAVQTIDNAIAGNEMQVDVLTMPTTTVQATNLDIRDLTSASDSVAVVGNVAHDAADSGNPVKIGGKARTSAPTAVANGDRVDAYFDSAGRQAVTVPDRTATTTLDRASIGSRCEFDLDGVNGFGVAVSGLGGGAQLVFKGTTDGTNWSIWLVTNRATFSAAALITVDSTFMGFAAAGFRKVAWETLSAGTAGTVTCDWVGTSHPDAGVFALSIGNVTAGDPDAGNPVKIGAHATSAASGLTAVDSGDRVNIIADTSGRQITINGCNLEDVVTAVDTDTAGDSTAGIAAQGAGIRVALYGVIIANSSSTFATVDLRDGTGGAVKATIPAPATSGAVTPFPVPIPFTANTAVAVDPSAALSTISTTLIGCKTR